MPKAVLEFNLPDEQCEFDDAARGAAYRDLLGNVYNWLREQWKYDAGDIDQRTAEDVWRKICELNDEGLEIP